MSGQRRRHTPEQIIRKLREGEKLLGKGQPLEAVCRHLEVSEATWHRWRAQYGGIRSDDAERLKERENARFKKMFAECDEIEGAKSGSRYGCGVECRCPRPVLVQLHRQS